MFNKYLTEIKGKPLGDVSQDIIKAVEHFKEDVTFGGVLRNVFENKPIISEKEISDFEGVVVGFDTETTGLTTREKEAISRTSGKAFTRQRNQIYELAATLFDDELKPKFFEKTIERGSELPDDATFHAKLLQSSLNKYNDPNKLLDRVKEYSTFKESDMDALFRAFKEAKDGFKFDTAKFKEELQEYADTHNRTFDNRVLYPLKDAFTIMGLMKMTKFDKKQFNGIFSGNSYLVQFYRSELDLIQDFFDFVDTKSNGKRPYIVAQNMPYDEGMVYGAIESAIKFTNSEYGKGFTRLKEQAEELERRFNRIFKYKFDTKDIFKKLIVEKRYVDIIEQLYEDLDAEGLAAAKIVKSMLDLKRGYKGKRSLSMGPLSKAFKIQNKEWHTASNDVYVMLELVKVVSTMPKIISELIKVSADEDYNPEYIGPALRNFARENDFHNRYEMVSERIRSPEGEKTEKRFQRLK